MDAEAAEKIRLLETEIAALRAALGARSEPNEELEQFAYVASHDLKEPLRIVANYLGLLNRRYGRNLDDRGVEYIQTAIDATARMRQLIDNLLEYGRMPTMVREPIDLAIPLDVAIKNLAQLISDNDAHVFADELPVVPADPAQMSRLFQNLIGNAVKYRSEATPQVRVRAGQHQGMWRITVTDNGMGIPEAHRDKVFAMFSRLHGRDEIEGSGIGLATCKRIVERHGGQIGLAPAADGGTEVWFTLPVDPPAAEAG